MGIFKQRFSEIENIIRLGEGNNAAYRRTQEIIENSFDPKWLKTIANETMYSDLSRKASERADYLSGLSRRERKNLEKGKKVQAAAQDEKKQLFNEAAKDKDRPEYWLKKLYEDYARENNVGRQQIEDGLLAYGDAAYPLVKEYLFSLASQYKLFTGGITEIRHNTSEGQRTKAIIEAYTNGMKYGAIFLAKFKHPDRIPDIANFYRYINRNIYSDPQSGFGDLFNAVQIRQYTVRTMGTASDQHAATASFYTEVLKDESRFVRWEAIDILKKQWTPEEIRSNAALHQALTEAASKEDNGVSNRKKSLAYLLDKERI